MTAARSPGRSVVLVLSALAVFVGLVSSPPVPSLHAPPATAAPVAGSDPEGGSPVLQRALEDASRGYNDARARLAASRQRQAALAVQLRAAEAEVAALTADVEALAVEAYRGGSAHLWTAALAAGSPQRMIDKLGLLEQLSAYQDDRVTRLAAAREELAARKRQADVEVGVQQAQERAMVARKAQAEKALAVFVEKERREAAAKAAERREAAAKEAAERREAAAKEAAERRAAAQSRASTTVPTPTGTTPTARPAPRAPDGTWPRESCSLDDPTSSGCLTPRTLHALQQARAAGFTRYTACYREASFGEHPKGRACDFAAARDGFGGAATGGDKAYGDRLAAYFLANADRLAVLYVIWYRRIWMPATGWRPYSSGGDPASAHTNHVHLSVQ